MTGLESAGVPPKGWIGALNDICIMRICSDITAAVFNTMFGNISAGLPQAVFRKRNSEIITKMGLSTVTHGYDFPASLFSIVLLLVAEPSVGSGGNGSFGFRTGRKDEMWLSI